jgi:hypothetical protein
MTPSAPAACVSAAAWVLSAPSRAAFPLVAVLRPEPAGGAGGRDGPALPDLFRGTRTVIVSAGACVLVAVRALSLPSPAVFRLTSVLRSGWAGAIRPVPSVVIAWLRQTRFVGSVR